MHLSSPPGLDRGAIGGRARGGTEKTRCTREFDACTRGRVARSHIRLLQMQWVDTAQILLYAQRSFSTSERIRVRLCTPPPARRGGQCRAHSAGPPPKCTVEYYLHTHGRHAEFLKPYLMRMGSKTASAVEPSYRGRAAASSTSF